MSLLLLGAPGVCCQQLLHQIKGLQVHTYVPCGKRGIGIQWLQGRAPGVACVGRRGRETQKMGMKGSTVENARDKNQI